MPELDVISTCSSRFETNALADHKRHGFGFGLAYLFSGEGSAVTAMQHFVGDLVYERRKFFGWFHAGKQSDFPALGQSFCWCNAFGVIQFHSLRLDELE